LIHGCASTQLVCLTARLGIADLLADGPRDADDLAAETGAHPDALRRVLRASAALGIFHERGDGTFALTGLSRLLQMGAPDSLRSSAIMSGEEWYWRPFGELMHSVVTGGTAFDHVFGKGFFDYLGDHPRAAAAFDNAMTGFTQAHAKAAVEAYDFSGLRRVVDVGGGHGSFLAAILNSSPLATGVLFDQPSVIAGASDGLEAEGVADRCELVAGDMFESVPAGGDAYVLKWIIHDWDDARAIDILKRCREAIDDRGRVVLIERVLAPLGEVSQGTRGDITMMALTGGRERTKAEFMGLLESSGFRLAGVVPTEIELSIIEARPV
jgi:hypothetical protein